MGLAQGINIDKLKLHSSRDDLPTIVSDLSSASWPSIPNDDWVFVRALELKAPKHELRLQAGRLLDSIVTQAVDGDKANALSTAVRFRNLPDLLAYLLRDIATNALGARWYWQRWHSLLNKTTNRALSDILWEHAEVLPAVSMRLIKIGALEAVLGKLEEAEIRLLLQRVHNLNAIQIENIDTNNPVRQEPEPPFAKESNPGVENHLKNQNELIRGWAACLKGENVNGAKYQFAAACVGLSFFPSVYRAAPRAFLNFFIAVTKTAYTDSRTEKVSKRYPPKALDESTFLEEDIQTEEIENKKQHHANTKPNSKKIEKPEFSSNRDLDIEYTTDDYLNQALESQGENIKTAKPNKGKNNRKRRDALSVDHHAAKNASTEMQKTGSRFESQPKNAIFLNDKTIHTEYGGFFFLINALRIHGGIKHNLDKLEVHRYSIWIQLYLIGRQFQHEFDTGLIDFICTHSAIENPAVLASQVQEIEEKESVRIRIAALYLEMKGRYPTIWNRELLRVPTSITFSASHIDCYFPMSSLRLGVRFAGLDVNPGWVPELSRLIHFFYRD